MTNDKQNKRTISMERDKTEIVLVSPFLYSSGI
jgi:hypothetical protein